MGVVKEFKKELEECFRELKMNYVELPRRIDELESLEYVMMKWLGYGFMLYFEKEKSFFEIPCFTYPFEAYHIYLEEGRMKVIFQVVYEKTNIGWDFKEIKIFPVDIVSWNELVYRLFLHWFSKLDFNKMTMEQLERIEENRDRLFRWFEKVDLEKVTVLDDGDEEVLKDGAWFFNLQAFLKELREEEEKEVKYAKEK